MQKIYHETQVFSSANGDKNNAMWNDYCQQSRVCMFYLKKNNTIRKVYCRCNCICCQILERLIRLQRARQFPKQKNIDSPILLHKKRFAVEGPSNTLYLFFVCCSESIIYIRPISLADLKQRKGCTAPRPFLQNRVVLTKRTPIKEKLSIHRWIYDPLF